VIHYSLLLLQNLPPNDDARMWYVMRFYGSTQTDRMIRFSLLLSINPKFSLSSIPP
jgi:hypothetical protein